VAPGRQGANEQKDQDDDQDDSHDIFLLSSFLKPRSRVNCGPNAPTAKGNGRLFHDQIIFTDVTPLTLLAI